MLLTSLEWRFPIARIERGFMAVPIGINYIAGKLFVDAGDAWNGDDDDIVTSVGGEIEFATQIFYRLPCHIRVKLIPGAQPAKKPT